MDVDEAGHDQLTAGIDRALRLDAIEMSHVDDRPLIH